MTAKTLNRRMLLGRSGLGSGCCQPAGQGRATGQARPLDHRSSGLEPAILGDGVVSRPYGKPSDFEKSVIRRDVEWLTASRQSSVSFHTASCA